MTLPPISVIDQIRALRDVPIENLAAEIDRISRLLTKALR